MLGDLNKRELLDLIENQLIGRLGCHTGGETYVVPVNYVYRNNAVYLHSGKGKKVDMMRANPKVCFQVDEIKNIFQWKSAILWGNAIELSGEERQQAMQGIIHRIMPLTNHPSEEPSHGIKAELHDDIIVFKIELSNISGRYETHEQY